MSEGAVDKEEQKLAIAQLGNEMKQERNRKQLRTVEQTLEKHQELSRIEAKFYTDTYLMNWDGETANKIYELMIDSEQLARQATEQLEEKREALQKEKRMLQEQAEELELQKRRFFSEQEDNQ